MAAQDARASIRKAAHVRTDLGKDGLCGAQRNSGHFVEPHQEIRKRAEVLFDACLYTADLLSQVVNVSKVLLEHEAVVGGDVTMKCLNEFQALRLEAALVRVPIILS